MIFLPDGDRMFIRLDKTPERDGQTNRIRLAITEVCIASNADPLSKLILVYVNDSLNLYTG